MALKKSMTITKPGFSGNLIGEAYWRVESVAGGKRTVRCTAVGYVDSSRIDSFEFDLEPAMDGENFIKQAYLKLKTLDGFSDAVDC